jgi:hypothetical protein
MGQLETSGYKGWWEGREFLGRTNNGVNVVKEVFRNMVTGEVYDPGEKGWDGSPPYPTGAGEMVFGYGGSEEFWNNMRMARNTTSGEVVLNQDGRVKIVYK